MTDPELKAMQALIEELDKLDHTTIKRIMIWLVSRYDVDLTPPRKLARKDGGARRSALATQSTRPKLSTAAIQAMLRKA